MSECEHHIVDREVAVADGMCPICLAARVAELERELRLIEGHSHPGYVIGQHWLSSAYERICAGEQELDVMQDYGYAPTPNDQQISPTTKDPK